MRISVTVKDIENGEAWDPENCPIAVAIKRICPDAKKGYLVVFQRSIRFMNCKTAENQRYLAGYRFIALPEIATRFICAVDKNKKVEPFEFDLPIECDWFTTEEPA